MIRTRGYSPRKFKAFLIENGFDPPSKFASVLGLTNGPFNKRMTGDAVWRYHELLRIMVYFKLTPDRFCTLFFDTSDEMFHDIRRQKELHDA